MGTSSSKIQRSKHMNGKLIFKNLHDLAEFIAHLEYQKVQSKWIVTRHQYTQCWELCFEE